MSAQWPENMSHMDELIVLYNSSLSIVGIDPAASCMLSNAVPWALYGQFKIGNLQLSGQEYGFDILVLF